MMLLPLFVGVCVMFFTLTRHEYVPCPDSRPLIAKSALLGVFGGVLMSGLIALV